MEQLKVSPQVVGDMKERSSRVFEDIHRKCMKFPLIAPEEAREVNHLLVNLDSALHALETYLGEL